MILKSFELNNIDLSLKNYLLFYGENQGLKNETIEKNFKKKESENVYLYDESEILNNKKNFFDEILSKSFFEKKKIVIIKRATDKIRDLVEEVIEKNITDIQIILNADALEKKSKLRSFFEKSKKTVCVPFYADNHQTLLGLTNNFFKKNKIEISQQSLNLIIDRCRGDRQNLNNELQKLESFIKNKKKINIEDILKLTNLAENYNISELIDVCLAKNIKKTVNILSESNYSLEDCLLIIRTFLMKSKRLLGLCSEVESQKNINSVISSFKPPIFWKDKDLVKIQIEKWSSNEVRQLIFKISEIELLIKKNSNNSINILSNFIIEQANN